MISNQKYDVVIIGGGVIGCAAAFELSRRGRGQISIAMVEQDADLAAGASRRNSGIVHGAYAASAGTWKGVLAAEGNPLWSEYSEILSIPLKRNGALVLAFEEEQEAQLAGLRENGKLLGGGGDIIGKDEVLRLEPEVNPLVRAAFRADDVGIISPYEATIHLGEAAAELGATLRMSTRVFAAESSGDGYRLHCSHRGETLTLEASMVINAAGIGALHLTSSLGDAVPKANLRRGEYLLFRRGTGSLINRVLFQPPGPTGKGILVTPTTWGNLLVGPNAQSLHPGDDDQSLTSLEGIETVLAGGLRSVPGLPVKKLIRDFAGIRAGIEGGDFSIEESAEHAGWITLAGIDSPGFTSAPAISRKLCAMVEEWGFPLADPVHYQAAGFPRPIVDEMPMSDIAAYAQLPSGHPRKIVCRCEGVTEKSIVQVLVRMRSAGIEPETSDSVKFRTRCGMGACQGAFCGEPTRKLINTQEVAPGRQPSSALRNLQKKIAAEQSEQSVKLDQSTKPEQH